MNDSKKGLTDQQIDQVLGNLLRTGVLLAATVVLLGGVLYLVQHGSEVHDYSTFQGEPEAYRSLSGIVRNAFAGHGRGIIQLGIVMLIATPVVRVGFSVIAFVWQRDWTYVVVTLIVLGVLLFGLAGGRL